MLFGFYMKQYIVGFFPRYILKSTASLLSNYLLCNYWQISSLANAIRVLANMKDPIGHVLNRTEVRDYRIRITLSVLSNKIVNKTETKTKLVFCEHIICKLKAMYVNILNQK